MSSKSGKSTQGGSSSGGSKTKAGQTARVKAMIKNAQKCTKVLDDVDTDEVAQAVAPETPSCSPPTSRKSSVTESSSPLTTMPSTANRLYQEAKTELEMETNMDPERKEKILNSLSGMYEMILRQNESRTTLQVQIEKVKHQTKDEICKMQREHAKNLTKLGDAIKSADLRPSVEEAVAEIKSLRQLIVFDVIENQKILPSGGIGEHEASKLVDQIQELKDTLLQTVPKTTAVLEEIRMRDQRPPIQTTQPTYAAIAAHQLQPKHTIIVTSEEPKDTGDDVMAKIRSAVDARAIGVQVTDVRKAKFQKILISCPNKNDASKIADHIKKSKRGLNVEEAKSKDPLVIIRDVLSYNTDDDILKSLKAQNAKIIADIPANEYRAAVKYRRRTRNPLQNHVILQVSPMLWQRLTAVGEVHIDLQRRLVMDQSPLIQCTKCLGFGHGRKLCKESTDLCSHCSGPHLRKDCQAWLANEIPTCRNCNLAKMDRHDHGTFDSNCPVRKRWDALARSSVAYC